MTPSGLQLFVTLGMVLAGSWSPLSHHLGTELRELDSMRKGGNTDLDAVDERGNELLQQYRDPNDIGQIYYELAIVHSQSGMKRPEQVIKYCKKALDYPLQPSQTERLYVFWGDALQVAESSKGLSERRKAAIQPYLDGLKSLLQYDLPDSAPELPAVSSFEATPNSGPVYEALKQKHDQEWAARKKAEFQREMVMHRDVLIGQIAGLYGQKPHANQEIEDLARRTLDNPALMDKLMGAVDAAVKADLTLHPEPKPAPPPSGVSSLWLRWALTIGVVVVLLFGFGTFWFLRRRKRLRGIAK
jgi:hypothetical protein